MFGQIPDFTNGFEFMRKLWGTGAGLPGGLMPGLQAMTPPMDLEDLDKRIHDLKAVESWLQLNTNLLRTTIQGLEVQRATLVALQTFGNALSPEAMQSAMENVARAANAPSEHPPQSHDPAPQPEPEAEPAATQAASGDDGDKSATPPPNAGIWWDMLQQQFNQIASGAAAASMVPFGNLAGFGAAPAAAPAAAKPTPRPRPAAKDSGDAPARRKAPAKKAPAKASAGKKAAPRKTAAPARPDDAGNADNEGNAGNRGPNNGRGAS